MTEQPTVKISQGEYRALVQIAVTADEYLRTGQSIDELRDAVLVSRAFTDDEAEDEAGITLPMSTLTWLNLQMAEIADYADINDAQRAKIVSEACQSALRVSAVRA